MRTIKVVPYNPKWAVMFQELKEVYENCLGNTPAIIEHVGSTSVVGLYAKPRIDIDIIVESDKALTEVIAKLETLGYKHQGDLGIKGREAMKKLNEHVPFNPKQNKSYVHNLYVCMSGCDSLENHLRFRDFLRINEQARTEYSELKQELAKKHSHDIDKYVEGKTAFITSILAKAGMSDKVLEDISTANQVKK